MNIIQIVPTVEEEASGPSYAFRDWHSAVGLVAASMMTVRPGAAIRAAFRHARYPGCGNAKPFDSLWISRELVQLCPGGWGRKHCA